MKTTRRSVLLALIPAALLLLSPMIGCGGGGGSQSIEEQYANTGRNMIITGADGNLPDIEGNPTSKGYRSNIRDMPIGKGILVPITLPANDIGRGNAIINGAIKRRYGFQFVPTFKQPGNINPVAEQEINNYTTTELAGSVFIPEEFITPEEAGKPRQFKIIDRVTNTEVPFTNPSDRVLRLVIEDNLPNG